METNKTASEQLKQAALQVIAGGSAGFIEVCIMQPLDLVKTRLQLQRSGGTIKPVYTGVFDCLKKMYIHEGFLSFYKGIVPPVLAETPKRAVKFLTFEQYKQFFMFGAPSPTPLTFSLAGMGAGLTEAILVNPFEVVKVTQQSNKAKMSESPSSWRVTKDIIKNEGFGLQGLNKGMIATMLRNGSFNSIYFGFYHSVKGIIPEQEDSIAEFFRRISIGFVSGTLGSCVNIPFDVAKSRIQGPQPVPGVVKYSSTFGTIICVYREEGWRALYKGLLPKVMRLGPGGAIMLVVYEHVYHLLMAKFP